MKALVLNRYGKPDNVAFADIPRPALNTALMTAQDSGSAKEARQDGNYWGRLVESCVGGSCHTGFSVTWVSRAIMATKNSGMKL